MRCNVKCRLIIAVLIVCTFTAILFVPASAKAALITETVSLANVNKNQRGEGYSWDNRKDTLTLDGVDIETEDYYGLKLPDNAVVVLIGNNTVSSSGVGLLTTGNTIFKGNGTLTVSGGETGIMLSDATMLGKVSFLSGTYKISGGQNGIASEKVRLYISGGSFDIKAASPDGFAISSRLIEMNNAVLTADNTVYSSEPMVLNNTALSITSSRDALMTDTEMRISNVLFSAGDSADSLAESKDNIYNGGKVVSAVPTLVEKKSSILFGGDVPAFVDYILITVAAVLLAAVIVVPLYIHRVKYMRRLEVLKSSGTLK